jgi:hypothetical protein
MTPRSIAAALTAAGGAGLLMADPGPAAAPGLLAALLGLAAVWLVSGTARLVLAGLAGAGWVAAAVLSVPSGVLPVVAAVAGLVGAGLTLAKGSTWSGWSSRYDRAQEPQSLDPRGMWDSLDRGEDPTHPPDADPN